MNRKEDLKTEAEVMKVLIFIGLLNLIIPQLYLREQ